MIRYLQLDKRKSSIFVFNLLNDVGEHSYSVIRRSIPDLTLTSRQRTPQSRRKKGEETVNKKNIDRSNAVAAIACTHFSRRFLMQRIYHCLLSTAIIA